MDLNSTRFQLSEIKYLNNFYPQNFIIRKPLAGSLIMGLFIFLFTAIYQPLESHPSKLLTYLQTMALYSIAATISLYMNVKMVKRIGLLSDERNWTIVRELVAIVVVLVGLGISIYGFGFIMEPPMERLNIMTFFDSVKSMFLVGMIPFAFFTAINYSHFNIQESVDDKKKELSSVRTDSKEEIIEITSQLKKEELCFYPCDFLYAEAEGNYVAFYLLDKENVKKVMIRNSMNSIEQQLSHMPFFLRVHRAYIINLKKVCSKHGNALGYRLKMEGIHFEIPVSRNNTKSFDQHYSICQS